MDGKYSIAMILLTIIYWASLQIITVVHQEVSPLTPWLHYTIETFYWLYLPRLLSACPGVCLVAVVISTCLFIGHRSRRTMYIRENSTWLADFLDTREHIVLHILQRIN